MEWNGAKYDVSGFHPGAGSTHPEKIPAAGV